MDVTSAFCLLSIVPSITEIKGFSLVGKAFCMVSLKEENVSFLR